MKKILMLLIVFHVALFTSFAQGVDYKILSERDTTIKAKIGSVSLGSREVKHIIYEYPSTDADGKTVTISGVIMIPMDVVNGSVPCDGIILYNHPTIGSPDDAPTLGGEGLMPVGIAMASPLKPNYIFVVSDYIGYGSSIDSNVSYISGDTNSRNALDGLLAAQKLFEEKQIPQGKFLFNLGFSQGGTVSMYAAKLTDTDDKYKGIRFDKTFSGGGPLDFEKIYTIYAEKNACDDIADVVLMLISVNENYHLGIDYKDMFKEPMASKALEYFQTKKKSVVSEIGVTSMDSISEVLTPLFMDLESEPAQKLRAKLKEISLTEGWEPDTTKRYFIEHSRHDNYVPIQSVRNIIPWMREKGFKPSIVPGKSTLQTNTIVFKLKHQQSGIVWTIQTLAAIQFWPVLYYEGEQNRYFHDIVYDLNLMKVIRTLANWGIDLKKIVNDGDIDFGSLLARGAEKQPVRYNIYDLIPGVADFLAKVDLTTDDLEEMVEDSGITLLDLLEAYRYIKDPTYNARAAEMEERIEGPLYLLRNYEQTLAAWYMLGGFNVDYENWGM